MGRQDTRSSLAPKIDLQSLGAELRIYGEIDDPNMRHFNPSIAWHNGKLKIAIRSCNFTVKRHGDWFFRDGNAYSKTDVLIGAVDPVSLMVSDLKKHTLSSGTPTRTKVAGLEDVRLFVRDKGLYAIGFESDRLTASLHNSSTSLAEYMVVDGELRYIRTLEKPRKNAVEKNWCPPDVPSKLFDYTYSPAQVIKGSELIGEPTPSEIHGGSVLLKQKDGTYLSIVHDKVADRTLGKAYDRFIYRNYLARHDKDGFIKEMTPSFHFGTNENIEFAAGMVEYEDDFIVSFGIRDCKYAIARVRKDVLTEMLKSWGNI